MHILFHEKFRNNTRSECRPLARRARSQVQQRGYPDKHNPTLIKFFHDFMWEQFSPCHRPRIYVYCPFKDIEFTRPVPGALYRNYVDPRANLPYYIYRVSGVELVHQWRKVVAEASKSSTNYQGILQGFFAGRGKCQVRRSKLESAEDCAMSQIRSSRENPGSFPGDIQVRTARTKLHHFRTTQFGKT